MESDVITLSELFRFKVDNVQADRTVNGKLVATGLRPTFLEKFERRGISLPQSLFSNSNGRVAPDYLRGVEA
jgi:pilus assembly protein CpaF